MRILERLTFYDIRVIYISQGIDSANPQAKTLNVVHGLVDSLYRSELVAKTKRGHIGQFERGYSTGNRTFGYRSVPVLDPTGRRDPATGQIALLGKRLAIHEPEAEIVRRIFAEYAAGTGVGTILQRLNREGVRNHAGGPWSEGALRRLLANERYLGRAVTANAVLTASLARSGESRAPSRVSSGALSNARSCASSTTSPGSESLQGVQRCVQRSGRRGTGTAPRWQRGALLEASVLGPALVRRMRRPDLRCHGRLRQSTLRLPAFVETRAVRLHEPAHDSCEGC